MAYIDIDDTTGGGGAVDSVNGQTGVVVLTAADVGAVPTTRNVNTTTPLTGGGNLSADLTLAITQATTSTDGYLSATDWNTFNSKPSGFESNFITNPSAVIDTSGWNLYNNSGNPIPATLVDQDLTYTAVASGSGGNGVNVDYVFHPTQSYLTPLVTVVSPTHITVAWYNGPTVSNNPTATQLKAAWDAVPGAVAIATVAISGTASHLQYIVGSMLLSGGGDTSPTTGTGGSPAGLVLSRNTISPITGTTDFILSKDAVSRQGEGVSTDFVIDRLDQGKTLQINFEYDASSTMVLGSLSDITVWIYDVTNATLIPVSPTRALAGPVSTVKTYVATFLTSPTSLNYRLIFHVSTTNATAWNFEFDEVTVTNNLNPAEVTETESLVLPAQPISGSVTDHMAVAWTDGATHWVPATSAFNGDELNMIGFATNIVGSVADIFVGGYMDGFSFGPFAGYNQYVDPANPGGLTPLPSPFTDTYLIMGKAISATAINIEVFKGFDLITSKGGLLSNSGANTGTGDQVLAVGANGNVLIANSASSLGLQWAPAVVASAPFTYTLSTRTLTIATATNSVAGVMSAADHQTLHDAVTIGTANGLSLSTQVLSMALATNSVTGALSAADHTTYSGYAATIALKANIASPTFTGTVTAPTFSGALSGNATTATSATSFSGSLAGDVTGTQAATVISAATVTGKLITGFVSGAGTVAATDTILQAIDKIVGNIALKANIASPTFTGTVTSPAFSGPLTGNVTGNVSGSAASFTGTLVGDVGGTQGATVIGANKVTNSQLAQMPAHTFKGNNTGSTANALDLTANQLSAELNSSIVNSSGVTGATVTDALNTLNQSVQEVLLSAIKNAGSVTANTTIPTWTTTSKDSLSGFNASTGVYTVQAAGDLLVNFTAALTLGLPSAQVYKNGTLVQTGIGSLTRTFVSTVVPNCVVGDTITVALDTSGTLTSTNTDNVLNIYQLAGATSQVINARYHGATATITGTLSNISWTTKDIDTANAYSGATFTVPSNGAGTYEIYGSIGITATTVAAGATQILTLNVNGVEISRYTFVSGAATQKPAVLIVTDLYKLSASDAVTFQVSSSSTTPVVTASTTQNRFFIRKVSN